MTLISCSASGICHRSPRVDGTALTRPYGFETVTGLRDDAEHTPAFPGNRGGDVRKLDISLCEVTHRDCSTEPVGFTGHNEAYAVMQLHAGHGPACYRYLAAQARVSVELED